MHVIGARKIRYSPYRVLQFALAAAVLRIDHALFSTPWHIEGDTGIPWLMANDWDHTTSRRFFWGQNYLSTYETRALARVGHAIWGRDGTIPVEFNVILGQLLSVAGATALFAAVRKINPKFGDRWWEFLAALVLLGFVVPGMARFSFSVGTGYSLTPLAVGLTAWLWARECAVIPSRNAPAVDLAIGLFVGLAQSEMRINLIPLLALAICLVISRLKHSWPKGGQWRPWALFALGAGIGFLPELIGGIERGGPATPSLLPLADRWEHLKIALAQSGVALGTLPYGTRQPEDALFYRGHPPEFAHDFLDLLSALLLGILAYLRREDRKNPALWIFWVIVAMNIAGVTFRSGWTHLYNARRYEFPMLIALSTLILLSLDSWLGRALAALRALGLAVYLWSTITYASPLMDMKGLLTAVGFNPAKDCLSGHGGDLTTVQALGGIQYKVIAHQWLLGGNYSRAIDPTDLAAIKASCRQIYHLDTGETPIEDVGTYCPGPRLIYRESRASPYRPPVRLFGC